MTVTEGVGGNLTGIFFFKAGNEGRENLGGESLFWEGE